MRFHASACSVASTESSGVAQRGLTGVVWNLPQRFPFKFFRCFPVASELRRTTIEGSATLNSKRLVVNISHDARPRFENHTSAFDRAVHRSIHNHSLGLDRSHDLTLMRDKE